ncbi:ubiquitin carboxyl-terminal hydrolase 15-like [Brevipalpus obovatus]|uniref:ubiquitin carboxyl-terminal hydrolase 15-like n=1 Tax=Brevipalpus obovatus TaxID=246614 RepID=UPI003D9E7879
MTKEMEMDVDIETKIPHDYTIEHLEKSICRPLKKDEPWYLISSRWFSALKEYLRTRDEVKNPGPIDNRDLFKPGKSNILKTGIQEPMDMTYLPKDLWDYLKSAFGIIDSSHCIRRNVIEEGSPGKSRTMIELYPLELKLCLHGTKEDIKSRTFSRVSRLKDLEETMRNSFNVDSNRESQLWADGQLINPHDPSSASKKYDNTTLDEAGLHSGSVVTLELINADGSWPTSRPRFGAIATRSSKSTPGLCGLMNLGNTCFMNSALQCMSNAPPLTEYFVSEKHWTELNTDNPLGMGGEMAKTYGELIKAMWSGSHTCLSPREFKSAVGKFSPTFSGYQQQDCQELMAFLLDGLHEDLNRVKKKPYIELRQDIDNRPDAIVATESWSNYKKRNDSIIVDTFHGLLKSTLVCPECQLVSVTFDPYCYLSLPLPVKREKPIEVIFVPTTQPSQHDTESTKNGRKSRPSIKINRLMVPKEGTALDICNAVAKVVSESRELDGRIVNPANLTVTEVSDHRFSKIYKSEDSYIQLSDVRVYERLEDHISLPCYIREKKNGSHVLCGAPLFVNLKERTYEALYSAVKNYVMDHYDIIGEKVDGEDEVDSKQTASPLDQGSNQGDIINHHSSSSENTNSLCTSNLDGDASGDCYQFNLTIVNSFGSLEIGKLAKNKPFTAQNCYIAADFKCSLLERTEDDLIVRGNHLKSAASGKSVYNLSECLEQFTTTERLGEHDPWYCPRCKKQQQATKKFDIWSLPKVSIIHLKRFSYSRLWREKLDVFVNFPLYDLDLGQYLINNPKKDKIFYNLIAVANHYGNLGCGHYTAYGKNKETGSWYHFDDSNVSPATEDSLVSKGAYVLFYLRQD